MIGENMENTYGGQKGALTLRGYSTQTHFYFIIEILFTIYIKMCEPIIN